MEEKAVETTKAKAEEEKAVEETKVAETKKPAKTSKAATKTVEEKSTTTKTAKAAKAVKEPVSEKIVLQVGGRADLSMEGLVEKVKAAYVAEGHKAEGIKNIEVYIKLDENMAYYVIDGYASGVVLY